MTHDTSQMGHGDFVAHFPQPAECCTELGADPQPQPRRRLPRDRVDARIGAVVAVVVTALWGSSLWHLLARAFS